MTEFRGDCLGCVMKRTGEERKREEEKGNTKGDKKNIRRPRHEEMNMTGFVYGSFHRHIAIKLLLTC